LSANKPTVIITLAHQVQTERLCSVIEKSNRDISCILDECHATMFPDIKSVTGKMTKYDSTRYLLECAQQIFAVSATPSRNLFGDEYPVKKIIRLAPSSDRHGTYKSVTDLEYMTVTPMEGRKYDFKKDNALREFLSELSKQDVFSAERYSISEDHPIFGLINVSREISVQDEIAEYIHKTYKNAFTTFVYNSKGCTVKIPLDCAVHLDEVNGGVFLGCPVHVSGVMKLNSCTPIDKILQVLRKIPGSISKRILSCSYSGILCSS